MSAVCGECGVPRIVARTHTWRDGCIVDDSSGNANFCLYEVSFHNSLFEKAGAQLGMPLDNLIVNAGRQASARVIEDLLGAHPLLEKLVFKAPFYHLTQKALVDFGQAIGVGYIEILEHRKGHSGVIRLTDPYHLAHCTAVVMGSMDVMYGYPVALSSEEEEGGCILRLRPGERDETVKEEAFARLASADLKPRSLAENLALSKCKACGAPSDIGTLYSFDVDKGVITEQLNQERVILIGVYSLNSILRELESELGHDIADLFIKAEEENFKKKLAVTLLGEDLRDMRGIRDYLALRGLGMLAGMETDGDNSSFTVENVYIGSMVAGRLLALCEYQNGRKCAYEYSLDANTLRLSIRPGDEG